MTPKTLLKLYAPLFPPLASLQTLVNFPANPLVGASTYTWDIAEDVYGGDPTGIPPTGIPPAPAYVDLYFTVTTVPGGCAGGFSVLPAGQDLCGANLVVLPGPIVCEPSMEVQEGSFGYPYSITLPSPGPAPSLTCAGPQTIECPATPAFTEPTLTMGCDPNLHQSDVTIVSTTQAPGLCPILYIQTRTWKVTDHCGNSASCSQTITVTDPVAPVVSTVAGSLDVTLECSDTAGLAAALALAPAADGCSPTIHLLSDATTPNGACAN